MIQHSHEGTPQQLAAWLVQLPNEKRYRVLIEKELETEEEEVSSPQAMPSEGMLSASHEIAKRQKGRLNTDGSETDRLLHEARSGAVPTERDPDLVTRVRSVRGKYARTDGTSGSEELNRERQHDKVREETKIQDYQP